MLIWEPLKFNLLKEIMIVINARFLTQNITGVQRYAIEICKFLPQFIKNKEVVVVTPKADIINQELITKFRIIQFGKLKGNLWEQIELPFFLKKNNNPLLINFTGIGPVMYKNKLTYIYDLSFKYYPETFSYFFQKAYNLLIPISGKNSQKVIAISNYVKKDIEHHYNFSNIEVIYAAQNERFKNLNLQREKIILAVSSLDPRKNFNRVIEAYSSLKTDYKLVFVGSKSKTFSDLNLDNNTKNKNIIFTGYIDDQELIKLYNKASIFIYASLFEGFGMPPLEAQACGCPCLVSDQTSLPEVYLESVEYCDPKSVDDIKDKLKFLIEHKQRRDELVQKGFKNIKRFNWQKSSEKFGSIIELYA